MSNSIPLIDTLPGDINTFPSLAKYDYFNHAGVSPWPRATIDAVSAFASDFGVNTWIGHDWSAVERETRERLAAMINASTDEVAIIRNTGDAISQIAMGIDWKNDDVIVTSSAEYPSNVFPWMEAARRHGCKVELVPERTEATGSSRVSEDELIEVASKPNVRLLAISHVQWGSGQRMDLDKLGAFCRSRGILFSVDVIQSLGIVPIDVRRSNIDFLMAGGHKWLMSPPGAGVLFCRHELIDQINPASVGWLSVINPMKWELNYTLRPEAGRFETGTPALGSLVGLNASLRLLLDVGISSIHQRVTTLGDYFADELLKKGYTLATPRTGLNGGSVCFTRTGVDPAETVKRLHDHKIEIATRTARLRFSPHFYNTKDQVNRLLERL